MVMLITYLQISVPILRISFKANLSTTCKNKFQIKISIGGKISITSNMKKPNPPMKTKLHKGLLSLVKKEFQNNFQKSTKLIKNMMIKEKYLKTKQMNLYRV